MSERALECRCCGDSWEDVYLGANGLCHPCDEYTARLEAEVKALREAGDWMADLIQSYEWWGERVPDLDGSARAWRALHPSDGREGV